MAARMPSPPAVYNPVGRPGEFTKNVTVRSNDKRHKRVTLKIKGFVNPAKK